MNQTGLYLRSYLDLHSKKSMLFIFIKWPCHIDPKEDKNPAASSEIF